MTNLNKMYDGVSNSPDTFLTSPLASGGNIMYVADSSVFGTLPNLAVLGSGANAETVLITSKRSDQGLNIQRAVEGVARDWVKATIVARNFTNYDYKQLKENIEKINNSKQEILTAGNNIQITNGRISATDTKYDDTQIKKDIATLKNSQLAKASQTEAESGVDNTKYMTPQTTKQAIEKLSPKQDLSSYAKKTDIKNKLSEMEEDSTHRTVTDTEKEKWNNVKSTEIVDNLTTDDATKALSAKQGKVLQDNKANKSDISRCKTKGYSSASSWSDVSSSRDLEDWIGDLDYRTRELKSNKGLTGASSEFKQQSIECNNARDCKLKAVKWGRIVQLGFYYVYNSNSSTTSSWEYTIPKEFIPSGAHFGVILRGDFEIIPKNDGSDARMTVRKEYGLNSGEIAGTIIYLARYQ